MDFIIDNIGLVLVAVASGAMLIWPTVSPLLWGIKDVGSLDAVQLMNHQDAQVLDVREESEFKQGHISNARNIPLAQLSTKLKDLEKLKKRPLLVHCQSGSRALRACGLLTKNGFEQVYNLRGGLEAWRQANLPIEKSG
ncbi:MAG: rhodanese-like domain-containing protein [Burkholderiales bacterium]